MTEAIDAIAIARIVELTEAAAWADLLAVAPADWRAIGERTPAGWLLSMPTTDMMLFNRLVGCGLDAAVSRDALDASVARRSNRNCCAT
jgi:hypothetical protein